MVRRLPRSCSALQRIDGHTDQADRASPGVAGRTRLHDVPLDCQGEEHDGQGDFFLEFSKFQEMAGTKNPIAPGVHDFLIQLNSEPERRSFLKPFIRYQTAE